MSYCPSPTHAACVFALLLLANSAAAIDLEQLLMPGPLSAGHADFETECSKCHQPFDAGAEPNLCTRCHESVAADLEAQSGFHGRQPAALKAQCRSCHSEHLGRSGVIVEITPATFDHSFTDFSLGGAHREIDCKTCHAPGTPYRETQSACASCHDADDTHAGRLGRSCGECHGVETFADAGFAHGETSFPLTGEHSQVACSVCHPSERYEGTPTGCASCHRLDDAHEGRFGGNCQSCHSAAGWKKSSGFDHADQTGFALIGAHARSACESCHVDAGTSLAERNSCADCHVGDDAHSGVFGTACGKCHGESAFAPARFDHMDQTGFRLVAAHASIACNDCHRSPVKEGAPQRGCLDCHRLDDIHAGRLGTACADCHDQRDFGGRILFDHELTKFPLLGIHGAAPCESCHESARFDAASSRCATCHRDTDPHDARLGLDCGRCHNPNDWRAWRFDHDRDSGFALKGAHRDLACTGCHTQATGSRVRAPGECQSCHRREDPHRGSFGMRCESCHEENTWRGATIRR